MITQAHIIPFGKHKGQKLQSVDSDYLHWLANKDSVEFKSSIGGYPAPVAAAWELNRRGEKMKSALSKKNLSQAPSASDSQISASRDNEVSMGDTERQDEEPDSFVPTPLELSYFAIDKAILLLLKDYAAGREEKEGFTTWLLRTLNEASELSPPTTQETKAYGKVEVYTYLNTEFVVNCSHRILVDVQRCKTSVVEDTDSEAPSTVPA